MRLKLSIPIFLCASALLLPTSAFAQIRVMVNGSPVTFSGVGPTKVGGRVLVPLRGVMEKIGAQVEWTQSLQRIDANKGSTNVVLTIGQREATVNGRTVSLDVPAMVLGGSTMVPLRFLGEAMGAEVLWNNATSTVDINTEGNTGGGTVAIESFSHNATGWIREGQAIQFSLRGTPGATASVIISGIANDIRLAEQSAGVYSGSWTAQRAIGLSKATVLGRLEKNGTEKLIQSSNTISVDNQPPEIRASSPTENSRVSGRPTIAALFDDNAGSGINLRTVTLTLNGRNIADDAAITGEVITYKPANALAAGQYTVVITAKDNAGNSASETWKFSVGAATGGAVTSVTHDATGKLQPGQVITFTLIAEPKGKAHFAIGTKFRRGAREVSAGKYVGEYTVRASDNLAGETVTGVFTDANGEVHTMAATRTLGGTAASSGALSAPTISEPQADSTVSGGVVVRGRAGVGTRVLVRVDYETTLVGLKVTGAITEVSTTVDSDGYYQTEELDLTPPVKGRNTVYTITATAVNSSNQKSKPTVVKVKG